MKRGAIIMLGNKVHENVTSVFENKVERNQRLWNVNDVAIFLGVSHRTIRNWVFQRRIPYLKFVRCIRFDPKEVQKWTLQ